MANYRAFGLTYGSDLVLSGLPTTDDDPDVLVRREAVPEWQGDATIQYAERMRIRGQECLVRFAGHPFAGYVRDGRLIQFEADPANDGFTGLHILGSCTGALLFQRGLVPLHGNAIATPQGAAIVVGRIGSGKSTTTLALLRRGRRLVADDISGISFDAPEPSVVPGFPRLKLWKSTLEHFGIDPAEHSRLRAGFDKFHYAVDERFCDSPQKLASIYVLHPGDFAEVAVRPVSGIAKLHAIRPHLYKVRFRDAVKNWPSVLWKMCRLADTVKVNIVERPKEGSSIEAVADAIERDL